MTTGVLIFTLISLIISYVLLKWLMAKNYFKRLNVPGPSPLPLIGNFIGLFKKGLTVYDKELIDKYGKVVGHFEGTTPILLTTDTRLIKLFMVKDFSKFVNKRDFEFFSAEPLDKMLNVLKDEKWRHVRSIVSSSFTGAKLKAMSKTITKTSDSFLKRIDKIVENNEDFYTKKMFEAFTIDIISSCCFGVEVNALDNPDHEFLKSLQAIFANTLSTSPTLIISFLFPKLAKFLSDRKLVNFFPVDALNYLRTVTNEIIKRRKSKLEKRDDFIQNMLEYEESDESNEAEETKDENNKSNTKLTNSKKTLSNEEILAQAILFLFGGYETTVLTFGFVAYNLALNQDSQKKLCEEIDEILKKNNNEVNYESVNQMKYLDMVITETLRMYPGAVRTDRIANDNYEFEGVKIPKGLCVTVPIWALHYDKDLFDEPEKFIPERFSEENKVNRDNEAFLAFGTGPRSCVGMRFAQVEIKLLMAKILSKYNFITCDQTLKEIVIDNSGMSRPTKPIVLKIKKRD